MHASIESKLDNLTSQLTEVIPDNKLLKAKLESLRVCITAIECTLTNSPEIFI